MRRRFGLRSALERGELRLDYLPTVRLGSGEVEGVEALLRWDRGAGAGQLPGSFLADAERSGAMVEVGRWVLETALDEVGGFARQAGADPLRLSMNLSYRELVDGGLPGAVLDSLTHVGYPPGYLCLEISERTLARDTPAVARALNRLREVGVQLSVDDFGTAASSLSLLQSLPVDELKIDRSFVARMHEDATSAAIARAVVYLARSLQLRTTAEGVELEAQERMLVGLRCSSAQGWLYARPLSSVAAAVAAVDSSAIRRRTDDRTAALWSGLGSSAATRLLADAFERAPIGMALIDGTGTHIAVNPALADLLGCPSTELVGRSCWDAVHPDDLALDQARLDAVLRGELPGYSLDERYVDTHGTSVWVEVTVGGVPEPPSERGPARLLRQIRSIEDRLQAAQRQSEVERLNVRLSEQTEVLAEANVRLAGFASALSHDLHQPLAALGAYLDLLVEQRTADLDADAANWLAGAHHSAGILRDAVSALRDTAQGFPVALGPVDLAATFDEALAELASELDEAGAEVDITSLPVVLGDRAMLGRVVANVLGNACRYRDATRPLRISIEARGPAADRVVVVIADNGRGFAPHELDSVFTPGRRGSAAFDRAGTGFGLFIVRSVINNLGGEVWAETADTGARVCIALRRGDAEDIAADVRLRATVAEQPS